ncbi:MAG: TetR/AcrR family transcriptional regulator [Longimicrobiales bacterium]
MLHTPKQTRSKKTLERILTAARFLMSRSGVEAVGITQIVKEAKSSVGSFYARFDGKEDLVRYLHELLWDEATRRWEGGLEKWSSRLDTPDRVSVLVELIQDAVSPDQRLRASLTRVMGEEGARARTGFDSRVTRDAVTLLDGDEGIRHPQPATCIPLGVQIALSSLRDRPSGDSDPLSANLPGELTTALRGYWGVGRVVQRDGLTPETQVEYFDIWS